MRFNSKYDWFYIASMVVITIEFLFFSNICFVCGFWYISIILLAFMFFFLYLFLWTSITLTDSAIEIRLGFFKKTIPYAEIKEIKRTKNIISSFATSVKRIGIRTSDKTGILHFIFISPEKPDEFLKNLQENVKDDVILTGFDTK